jgi:hypothetical protein
MNRLFSRTLLLALLTMPAAALAAPAESPSTSNPPAAVVVASPAPFGTALDESIMGKTTARADTSMIAQSQQTSTVSQNSVTGNSVTGTINIADNALQNANGLVLMNNNTGNNVSMNGAMTVNIIIAPPSPQN